MKKSIKNFINVKYNIQIDYQMADFEGQAGSDKILELLEDNKPCMIGRIGSTELECISEYKNYKNQTGTTEGLNSGSPVFSDITLYKMYINSGFFPSDKEKLAEFCELMNEDMKEVNILGTWLNMETLFEKELENCIRIKLPSMEPYYHQKPWTSALEGKTVLVVHPFSESIKKQYKRRELLFENKKVLPEFKLKTIKAVQSIAGERTEFSDWFESLDYMKDLIDKTSFDVAIIGCGAYGFPLAAHVKRMGKKSVHLGGATQILFGIIGRRWEEEKKFISSLMNKYWIRPGEFEKPRQWKKVENGCYW